ncbi:hypothetical protein PybrP1_007109 [[Pythium] brassicae (nom. inval.)]|nr:hypothetical protein PybrP1_007109 [[Pythium] brassicae (nom. inval.)]
MRSRGSRRWSGTIQVQVRQSRSASQAPCGAACNMQSDSSGLSSFSKSRSSDSINFSSRVEVTQSWPRQATPWPRSVAYVCVHARALAAHPHRIDGHSHTHHHTDLPPKKLANERLEEEARRRQQEQLRAQELELERVERERVAAQQRAAHERERVRQARQAERDRIARLERDESDAIARAEAQLSSVGAVCVGKLQLREPEDGNALPLSVAVLTIGALETPIANAVDSVLVADSRGVLHAYALASRALVFSASFAASDREAGARALQQASAMRRAVCDQSRGGLLVLDLHVLFGLFYTSDGAVLASGRIDGLPAIVHFFSNGGAEGSGPLASPCGVAFDDTGSELFVSDEANHCINVYAFSADSSNRAAPSASKSTKATHRRLAVFSRTIRSRGHDNGQLRRPTGLDVSHYHVVVCDHGNHRLAVFAKRGSFVTSIGRKGTADGAFYDIRDVKLVNVRKVVAVKRGGLQLAESVIASEQFEIVVADLGNFRVQVLSESGAFLRQLSLLSSSQHIAFQRNKLRELEALLLREYAALGGDAEKTKPMTPPNLCGAAMDHLYKLAQRLHPSSAPYARISAAQARVRETRSRFHHPLSIAYAPTTRELVFADHENDVVIICNADGSRTTWLQLAQQEERVSSVHSVLQLSVKGNETPGSCHAQATDDPVSASDQARLYISDPQSHRVAVFDADSRRFLFYIGATTYGDQILCSSGYRPGELRHPTFLASFASVAHESAERTQLLVVSDSGNHVVSLFDARTGEFCRRIGQGFGHLDGFLDSPQGVAVFENRLLYVCDQRNHRVQVFDVAQGSFACAFGRQGSAVGEFSFPTGVAVASALPQGDLKCDFGPHRGTKVVVADTGNHRVQIFAVADFQVLIVLTADATPLDRPLVPIGVFVDARSGAVLVCDAENKCGVVFRQGGTFIASFGSTVEPANRFDRPMSVVKSACGTKLFVADSGRRDVCTFELRKD